MDRFNKNDEDLIQEYQQGDKEALSMIFCRYKRPILNFCLRILGNRADAEDVTGEVFLVLFSRKYVYQPEAKFSTWLYTIARNLCITRIRKKRKFLSFWVKKHQADELDYWDMADDKELPSEELQKKEMEGHVKKAITRLPVEQKEAIIFREYHDLSYEEIAQVLGCSLEKVKILIFRARERLRRELPSFIKLTIKKRKKAL